MAARSTKVTLINSTHALLVLNGSSVVHGDWNGTPPNSIQPHTSGVWQNDETGFATGDQGWVTYLLVIDNKPAGQVNIAWHNPYIGSNTYTETCPPGFVIGHTGGVGDNTSVFFNLGISQESEGTERTTSYEK